MVHFIVLFYLQKSVGLRFWKVFGESFRGDPTIEQQTGTEIAKFWGKIPVFEGLARSVFQPKVGQPTTVCAFLSRLRLTQTQQVTLVRTFIELFQIFAGFWGLIGLLAIS